MSWLLSICYLTIYNCHGKVNWNFDAIGKYPFNGASTRGASTSTALRWLEW